MPTCRTAPRMPDESMNSYDVITVGGGPTGLACAIEAKRQGLTSLVLEKGCVVNSLYHYPVNMVFFTTPELLEIGEIPLVTQREKATRLEALKYYRLVAQHYGLEIHQYEEVQEICGADGNFEVQTRTRQGVAGRYRTKKMILATGYYDMPNLLGIPGEDLPKVSHYYLEAHPYYNSDVAVIGGRNSAAETALDLYRHGARVTLIHRSPGLSDKIKYWIRPDIENRIRKGEIQAFFNTRVTENSARLHPPGTFARHWGRGDRADAQERLRTGPHRLSSGCGISQTRRRGGGTAPNAPLLPLRYAREQRAGALSGRGNYCGDGKQRNFH